jgi:hypothetical protein
MKPNDIIRQLNDMEQVFMRQLSAGGDRRLVRAAWQAAVDEANRIIDAWPAPPR